jgi:hypothetical protein
MADDLLFSLTVQILGHWLSLGKIIGMCYYIYIIYFSYEFVLKKENSMITQRKFELNREQIRDTYQGLFT